VQTLICPPPKSHPELATLCPNADGRRGALATPPPAASGNSFTQQNRPRTHRNRQNTNSTGSG
jgi:hypothetical protein